MNSEEEAVKSCNSSMGTHSQFFAPCSSVEWHDGEIQCVLSVIFPSVKQA